MDPRRNTSSPSAVKNAAIKGKGGKKDRKSKKQRPPAVKFILTVVKILAVFFITLACASAGIIGGMVYGYMKSASPITAEQLVLKNLTSYVYDKDGKPVARLRGLENRTLVDHKDIPDNLRNAIVSIEDERFYKHHGIDIRRIISAGVGLLTHGHYVHGGSTLTQQLVKNITMKTDEKLQRKIQEWWQAIQLERKLTKDQILDNYMNRIWMGYNIYGVQSASRQYLGKDVKDLDIAECAAIAGIVNLPSRYDPFTEKGRERTNERRKLVLSQMLKLGYIDKYQYDQAANEEIHYMSRDDSDNKVSSTQSYFVDQLVTDVENDLMEQYNISETAALTAIYNQGYQIYSTEDSAVQAATDEVFNDEQYFPTIKGLSEHSQGAIVILDPKTGQIRALYGGYGPKKGDMILSRASSTLMQRQAGSSFKPIAVYAPALDLHLITPATVVDDAPAYMDTQNPYKLYPENFTKGTAQAYMGLTTIRDGVAESVNVVAAKVWRDILGPQNSLEYLKKVGIDRDNEPYVSLALGGLNKGVNPLQMAAAYASFVHKGMYCKPATYTKVLDKDGNTVLEKKPSYTIAYDESTAYLMTSMLQDVVKRGTAAPLGTISNAKGQVIPTAGKTGTTTANKDRWFVGYSNYYVAAVWFGYDHNHEVQLPFAYNPSLKIWNVIMTKIHADLDPVPITDMPANIVKEAVCIDSGKVPTALCYNDQRGSRVRVEEFVKGTEPSDDDPCDVHVKALVDTSSKDSYGRPLLANSGCPPDLTKELVFIRRKVPYTPRTKSERPPADIRYELPDGEYCTKHAGSAADNTESGLTGNENVQPDSGDISGDSQPAGTDGTSPKSITNDAADSTDTTKSTASTNGTGNTGGADNTGNTNNANNTNNTNNTNKPNNTNNTDNTSNKSGTANDTTESGNDTGENPDRGLNQE